MIFNKHNWLRQRIVSFVNLHPEYFSNQLIGLKQFLHFKYSSKQTNEPSVIFLNSFCFLFLQNSPQTQTILLQNHWLPLFLLSLMQCSSTINLTNILTTLLTSKKMKTNKKVRFRFLFN